MTMLRTEQKLTMNLYGVYRIPTWTEPNEHLYNSSTIKYLPRVISAGLLFCFALPVILLLHLSGVRRKSPSSNEFSNCFAFTEPRDSLCLEVFARKETYTLDTSPLLGKPHYTQRQSKELCLGLLSYSINTETKKNSTIFTP